MVDNGGRGWGIGNGNGAGAGAGQLVVDGVIGEK